MSKAIAKYLRLSLDDDSIGESNSITAQRQIINDFIASMPCFAGVQALDFADDGYSGTDFNRPDVKRMLEAVRKGEIGCIIVKDFSRFGRHYLEVSKFIEQIFPYLGVRFISINDHYDSDTHKGSTPEMDVPVRNLINAMYSRDISKKLKSAKQTQMKQGVFANSFACFGYTKDTNDRHHLLIDEPAAQVVRRIFSLADEGYSGYKIASILNADNILTPAVYKAQQRSALAMANNIRTIWTAESVSYILRDERYTGTLVGGKRENGRLGTGKRICKSKESWIKVPGAYPAIISHELFNSVSAKRKRVVTTSRPNTGRVLYKRVRCGYCDHIFQYNGGSPNPYFLCTTVRYTQMHGCQRELFREREILDIVGTIVKTQIGVIFQMDGLLQERKRGITQSVHSSEDTSSRLNVEISQAQAFKRQLYERYKGSTLDKTAYLAEREALDVEIEAKRKMRDTLLTQSRTQVDTLCNAQQLLESFRKYMDMPNISDAMIDELVETVYVYSADRIEVRFSFMDELERVMTGFDALHEAGVV